VWVDRDDDLMDVTVTSHGTPSVVHTTAHHPFWDATRHAWVEADRLTPGDQLRSVDGGTVTYTSEAVVPGTADMWDLTITSDHDFYIRTQRAGTVLVHNCPKMLGEDGPTVQSKTLYKDENLRIDVENPNPGVRPGQLHLQPKTGGKYLYDFGEGEFRGLPRAIAKLIEGNADVGRAIVTAGRYLGIE
jgi:hypothetical protein